MLKHRNSILLVLFSIGFVKFSLFSPTIPEALILLIVGSVFGYCEYKNSDSKLIELEKKMKEQEVFTKDLAEKVGSIKIIQQVKPNNVTFR